MYSELEQTVTRELDAVASSLVVPQMPALPASTRGRSRWHTAAPVLVAAAMVVAIPATVLTLANPSREAPAPAPSPIIAEHDGPVSRTATETPVVVAGDLYVGAERVPGRWLGVQGSGTHWVGQRVDGSWWWGYDPQPQQIEHAMDQPPAISPGGGYIARVLSESGAFGPLLVGADTEEGGEGFGGYVDLPDASAKPAPRAVAVTDEGLVVAGGADFQWLWRPLVDGKTVDLAQTASGQVIIGNTGAGLLVNEGEYGAADGTQGTPYLARLSEDGILTRLGTVPTHDVLEASEEWLAYVPPGTVTGEASGTTDLLVRRVEGSAVGVLRPPDGWLFVAPGFRWETSDRLLALVVTADGGEEALVRCRPDPGSCVLVDMP